MVSLMLTPQAYALPALEIKAKAAVLVDADEGRIIFGQNEQEREYPASITKVMTALLTLEAVDAGKLSLDQPITASAVVNDQDPEGSSAGIEEGEVLTVEQLLYCLLLVSANEAADILAETVSGSREAFVELMNQRAQELGCTIFEVDGDGRLTLHFDRDIIRKLWDSYYVPFIKGYFSAAGRFRSDDIKTGNLLCYVGSSSSGTFFPSRVITSDTESHDITLKVLPCPKFADGESFAVQQGAGMVVTAADEAKVRASVEFLKWFTLPENDISFSVGSGYMPVTKAANNMDTIKAAGLTLSPVVEQVLTGAVATINENRLYTPLAFEGCQAARKVLEYALSDKAAADRAIVVERIAAGMSAEEAEAEFLTDECFDSWYQETLTKLQAYE